MSEAASSQAAPASALTETAINGFRGSRIHLARINQCRRGRACSARHGSFTRVQSRYHREPKAESRKPRAEGSPKAESRKPRAESREPKAESLLAAPWPLVQD